MEQATRSTQSISEQWTTFFQEAYAQLYTPFLREALTARETEGIVRLLDLPTGSALLDLGCAYGRHAIPLAQKGYRVTGLDLNEDFLRQAQTESEKRRIHVQWVKEDMRQCSFSEEFDGIISIFTSFGFFEEAENQQLLAQIYTALKPGGKFLIDTVQQGRVLRSFAAQGITRYDDGLIVLEERRFDLVTARYHVQELLLFPDGIRQTYQHSLRVYTPTELIHLLEAAGLSVIACYGSVDGRELGLDTRLVILSERL